MTRTTPFVHGDTPVLLDIVADERGSAALEFRTSGRRPTCWRIELAAIFADLTAAPKPAAQAPQDPAEPGGYIGEFRPMSRAELEHELAIDDSLTPADERVVRAWLYSRQAYWAAKPGGSADA